VDEASRADGRVIEDHRVRGHAEIGGRGHAQAHAEAAARAAFPPRERQAIAERRDRDRVAYLHAEGTSSVASGGTTDASSTRARRETPGSLVFAKILRDSSIAAMRGAGGADA
jgi:hypothetical protein